MAIYNVGHAWTNPAGQPYLRIMPGGIENIDIAFFIADAITNAMGLQTGVYLLNLDTLELEQMERPESTTPAEDMPRIRILPGNDPEGAPDVGVPPTEGGGGIGGGIGGGGNEEPEPTP